MSMVLIRDLWVDREVMIMKQLQFDMPRLEEGLLLLISSWCDMVCNVIVTLKQMLLRTLTLAETRIPRK